MLFPKPTGPKLIKLFLDFFPMIYAHRVRHELTHFLIFQSNLKPNIKKNHECVLFVWVWICSIFECF